ncbi:hypothetical protein T03_12732 [Trichinella britovi]|uniref:Uncharacterized protein n=1 Tax=Trichinella britovi TaxID=45882 RepID=A0A0V1D4S8_TRIBR|nr:hypothetical protein T03_12732 [Trichinella britovi]
MAYNLPQYIVQLHCSEVSKKDFPDNDGRQPTLNFGIEKFFDIVMRYSLKMPRARKRGSSPSETPLILIDDS